MFREPKLGSMWDMFLSSVGGPDRMPVEPRAWQAAELGDLLCSGDLCRTRWESVQNHRGVGGAADVSEYLSLENGRVKGQGSDVMMQARRLLAAGPPNLC